MNFNKIHEVMPYPWGGLDESWILPYPNKPSYFSNLNTKPTQLNYPIVAPRLGKNMWWLEKQSMFNFANLLRKLRNIAYNFFPLLGRLFCAHRINIWPYTFLRARRRFHWTLFLHKQPLIQIHCDFPNGNVHTLYKYTHFPASKKKKNNN